MEYIVGIAAIVALVVMVASLARGIGGPRATDHWLPPDLRGATIAYAEKTFRSMRHGLVARLDRAYQTATGYRLVEFKTRRRHVTYDSDVIELSVQRVALQEDTGQPVDEVALVVTQVGAERRTHVVQLLTETQVVQLARRREGILDGSVAPNYAKNPGMCRKCAMFKRCRPGESTPGPLQGR